jgi:oligopeptide transport system ATP-binding protein
VERGPVKEVFKDTRMPYTLGLLKSLPRLDRQSHEKLIQIEGSPPDMRLEPKGCPFAPRCPYRKEFCLEAIPPLLTVPEAKTADHTMACWVDVRSGDYTPDAKETQAKLGQRQGVA